MSPLRLVHVVTVPESLVFFTGQPSFMRAHGFEVRAISSEGPFRRQFTEREGVPVDVILMERRITPLRDLAAIVRMQRRLRALRPAIVHAHTPKGGLIGMLSAWLARVPVRVYHIHGLPLVTAGHVKRRILTWTERISCRLATDVLCVSPSVRDVARRERLNGDREIAVLCRGSINGVDAMHRFDPSRHREAGLDVRQKYGIPVGAPVLGFVGRLVRDKGIDELMMAWRQLRAAHPDLHLLLVGPFEQRDAIHRDTRAEMERHPDIHLHGTDWDTPPLFAAMDVLVLPSFREGLPVVPLEAAAMALPVVATAIPGTVDAVADGATGILVPPHDAVALRDAIDRYLGDPLLRLAHGRAGRERVLRLFRQEHVWAALLDVYVHALARNGMPVPGAASHDAAMNELLSEMAAENTLSGR